MTENKDSKIEQLFEKSQLLIDNLYDAIWVVDVATMTFDYITPSIETISGYRQDEYIGKSLRDRMPERFFEEVTKTLSESLVQFDKGNKAGRTLEIEMIHKNGGIYWVEVTARIVEWKDSSYKIFGVTREITKRKQYEISQEELIHRLNETLAEKQKLMQENKVLRDMLPICSGCKRIRDENDQWWPLDHYIERHTDSSMTHTICPDCRSVLYSET